MKQQLAQKNQQKNPSRDPNREPMTLSSLWQLWIDNLKSWARVPRGARRPVHPEPAGGREAHCGVVWAGAGRRRHLVKESRDSRFPESEHGAAQLFLFFWNSLPRLGANLRERLSLRPQAAHPGR